MISRALVVVLMICSAASNVQAQGLPRRTFENRLRCPATSVQSNLTATNEAERATLAAEAEGELWRSWPTWLDREDKIKIFERSENLHKCVYIFHSSSMNTNTWSVGCGKSCIILSDNRISPLGYSAAEQKIDSEGRVIWVGKAYSNELPELKWVDEEVEKALELKRAKWAKEHGMTLDEAKAKYAKWKEEHSIGRPLGGLRRPGMLGGGSLRARRLQRQQEAAAAAAKQRKEQADRDAERQAQAERERQQREQERAEQRQQLLAIQEELKRVHEAKAAAEKK